jgi:hypothetical protein
MSIPEEGRLRLSASVLMIYYAAQHCGGKRRPRRMRWKGAANDLSGIRQTLGHELVDVVVVAVLDARADAAGPRSPHLLTASD